MLYQLLHKMFGWDYVGWQNIAASGIARVCVDGSGRPYYFRYKSIKVIDIIHEPSQVVWLTCSPSKYFPEPNFEELSDAKFDEHFAKNAHVYADLHPALLVRQLATRLRSAMKNQV